MRVSDHEVKAATPMATYDSLVWLRETHPDCEFSFVIGSDWLQPGTDLRTWQSHEGRTGERLVTEFDFLVFPRARPRVYTAQPWQPSLWPPPLGTPHHL